MVQVYIINTRSDIQPVLNVCKIIFKDYNINILNRISLIIEKLLDIILNLVDQPFWKNNQLQIYIKKVGSHLKKTTTDVCISSGHSSSSTKKSQ